MKIYDVKKLNKNQYEEIIPTEDFWEKPGEIVTNIDYLNNATENVDLELGEKIAAKLVYTLNNINRIKKQGIGLTANQIGINASVFVMHVSEIRYFINPEVVEVNNNKVRYKESCLSLPGKKALISRNTRIKIKADNLKEPEWFGVEYDGSPIEEEKLLEAVVIQHEYNHTDGILITDLNEMPEPIKAEKEPGRNEIVKIKKDEEIKEIKYKKFDSYKREGWILI